MISGLDLATEAGIRRAERQEPEKQTQSHGGKDMKGLKRTELTPGWDSCGRERQDGENLPLYKGVSKN